MRCRAETRSPRAANRRPRTRFEKLYLAFEGDGAVGHRILGIEGVLWMPAPRALRRLQAVFQTCAYCRAIRTRQARGNGVTVRLDDRDARARNRRCRVEPRHEDQRVQRAVLHADAEIGDLNEARARTTGSLLSRQTGRVLDRLPFLDRRPDEPGARRFERLRPGPGRATESCRRSHRAGDRSGRRPARRGNRTSAGRRSSASADRARRARPTGGRSGNFSSRTAAAIHRPSPRRRGRRQSS